MFFTRFTIQAASGVDPSRFGDADEDANCTGESRLNVVDDPLRAATG
jgi:hypothetical protein